MQSFGPLIFSAMIKLASNSRDSRETEFAERGSRKLQRGESPRKSRHYTRVIRGHELSHLR